MKQAQGECTPIKEANTTSMDEHSVYIVSCPVCEKRVFDVSELPEQMVKLRYKCPHCRSVVVIPLSSTVEGSTALMSH